MRYERSSSSISLAVLAGSEVLPHNTTLAADEIAVHCKHARSKITICHEYATDKNTICFIWSEVQSQANTLPAPLANATITGKITAVISLPHMSDHAGWPSGA